MNPIINLRHYFPALWSALVWMLATVPRAGVSALQVHLTRLIKCKLISLPCALRRRSSGFTFTLLDDGIEETVASSIWSKRNNVEKQDNLKFFFSQLTKLTIALGPYQSAIFKISLLLAWKCVLIRVHTFILVVSEQLKRLLLAPPSRFSKEKKSPRPLAKMARFSRTLTQISQRFE